MRDAVGLDGLEALEVQERVRVAGAGGVSRDHGLQVREDRALDALVLVQHLEDDVAHAERRQRRVVELARQEVAERLLDVGLAEHRRVQEAGEQRLALRRSGALGLDGQPDLVVGDDARGIHGPSLGDAPAQATHPAGRAPSIARRVRRQPTSTEGTFGPSPSPKVGTRLTNGGPFSAGDYDRSHGRHRPDRPRRAGRRRTHRPLQQRRLERVHARPRPAARRRRPLPPPRQQAFYHQMGFMEIREMNHPIRAFVRFN